MQNESWVVCQIGAREHYAIPRALHCDGRLTGLITDFWCLPSSWLAKLPKTKRLRDRFHPDVPSQLVHHFNTRMLAFEAVHRFKKSSHWGPIISRNQFFQGIALAKLRMLARKNESSDQQICLFSYSYAALELFQFAKQCGWTTVLGQIDPGPLEERIVQDERKRVGGNATDWQPAPALYWDYWREETELADRIVVNSNWSKKCLIETGIRESKLDVIPLVYAPTVNLPVRPSRSLTGFSREQPLRVLFLGQVNLRKGVVPLLDAMRMLEQEPVKLLLAGPTDMDQCLWRDRPNVQYIGPVPRSQVTSLYHNADVFILPTLSDGYALTQLEALAHGLPVIASKNCGDAVTHGTNGLLLECVEPEAIAASILQFAAQPITPSGSCVPSFRLGDLSAALSRIVS